MSPDNCCFLFSPQTTAAFYSSLESFCFLFPSGNCSFHFSLDNFFCLSSGFGCILIPPKHLFFSSDNCFFHFTSNKGDFYFFTDNSYYSLNHRKRLFSISTIAKVVNLFFPDNSCFCPSLVDEWLFHFSTEKRFCFIFHRVTAFFYFSPDNSSSLMLTKQRLFS